MKKRTIAVLLAGVLVFSLAACGDNNQQSSGTPSESAPSQQQSETPQQSESPSESDPAASGRMEGSGDLGDYHVEIKGAALAEDYEGKPAIVITYAWTNNSNDTTSAMVSVSGKAFQDGVELDVAIIGDQNVYDSDAFMKDVRPGTTIDVQCAYVLASETSTIEFELTEWISFSDDMVTMDFDPASLQ